MTFGIKLSAPEVYQKRMREEATSHVDKSDNFIDDIIVWGNVKEHDEAVEKLMNQCRQAGVTLNKKKMNVAINEVNYLGDISLAKTASEQIQRR